MPDHAQPDPRNDSLDRRRQWRNRVEPEMGMGFLKKQFKTQVEKPYKQLASLVRLWEELVPAELAKHARLESLVHGVLRVAVDSSVRLYELDRLLRQGLERELVTRHKGPAFRKIQLKLRESAVPDARGQKDGSTT